MKEQIIKDGDEIVVWFSSGAASAVAAKRTIEKYGHRCNVVVVNNPIKEEHTDNTRFLLDVQEWLGKSILFATNPKFPNSSCVEVWDKRKYMSGINGAPCTLVLKKEARYRYEKMNRVDWHVLGFTAEEQSRHNQFTMNERSNVIPVLIDLGITKDDCYDIIQEAGIELPMAYVLGMPNANGLGCVKATSPTYWNFIRLHFPQVFNDRAKQSRRLGVRLVRYKGKRIFLDELPADAKGRSMKSFKPAECGIFCK